jgi:DUF4097 and DUF4098 domain-containing protein YvlB
MVTTRILGAVTAAALAVWQAGCLGGGGTTIFVGGAKQATEERHLTAPHAPATGLAVRTNVGSVDVAADPALTEVKVTAKVTAFGDTDEEAQARLQDVQVTVRRRDDRVLEIAAEYPKGQQTIRGGCSFVVRIPAADGVQVRSGNGAVILAGLGGAADAHTGIGPVTVHDQGGAVNVQTGNGAVLVIKAAGDVHATTSIGKVEVRESSGAIRAKTGNGAIEIAKAGGAVEASSSIGPVTIHDAAGDVTAQSGNGAVKLARVRGAAKAKSSIGPVTLEQVAGKAEAVTGNGPVTYAPAAGGNAAFNLTTSIGSVTVRLPAGAGGKIRAGTSVGSITVNGPRQPRSVTGDRTSKEIVLSGSGPESKIHTGNGSITITVE